MILGYNGRLKLCAAELRGNNWALLEKRRHTSVTTYGWNICGPIRHSLLWDVLWIFITCVSGSSEPMLVAPSLTTSVSWVVVLADDWAAWASFSWLDAAPATSSLVSSTSVLAVFKMLSLRDETHCVTICSTVTLKYQQYEGKLFLLFWSKCLFCKDNFQFLFIMWDACWVSGFTGKLHFSWVSHQKKTRALEYVVWGAV